MREKFETLYYFIRKLLDSKRFMAFIVIIFILQSVWIAASFRFPMLYDEDFHFDATRLYSQQISPVISSQPTYYDMYGSFSHGGATLFHYFMSIPFRIMSIFTNDKTIQVVSLRLICIVMVAVGILLYNRLFQKIGIKQIFINIGMLIFILLPIVTLISATINYDNMLFPLTALYLIICTNVLMDRKLNWRQLAWLVIIGCTASLVKYTFLPIFAISILFLTIVIYRRYKKNIFSKLYASFISTSKKQIVFMVALLALSVWMFSSIYIHNVISYKSLQPSCQQVMSKQRCSKNSIALRDNNAELTKETRPLMQNPDFISIWVVQISNWTNITGIHLANGRGVVVSRPLPIIYTTVFIGGFVGLSVILYTWRSQKKNLSWYFLISVSVFLILTVFMQNYHTYIKLHMPYSIQPRYILTIVPILIVFSIVATNLALRKYRLVKLFLLFFMLILFSQGGGLVTHIIKSNDGFNWDYKAVRQINNSARNILNPFVKEN